MKSGRNKETIFMTPNDFIADPISLEMSNENDIKTLKNINHYYQNRSAIGQRLMELEEEWDIERLLELNTGLWAVISMSLGLRRNRFWLLLALGAGALLATQALQGNSAAVP